MTGIPLVWIYWAVSLTIVTYISSFIVKKFPLYGYAALTGFYVMYLGASQIFASRIVIFNMGFYKFYAPSAVFIYPFSAQVIDMINEVYGAKKTYISIGIAFISQVLLICFIIMIRNLSPAPFFQYEEAWRKLFGLSIRIIGASWISFLICENLDAYIFANLKRRFEKNILLRSVTSDVADLTLDSLIFVSIAFYGIMPIIPLIIGQIVSKNIIGILDTPWFLWYKKMVGSSDHN